MSQDNYSSILQVITGDIFEMTADALVFSANHKPAIGGILDGQIYQKADQDKLLNERENIGYLHGGQAEITTSCGLPGYEYLIHAAVPVYKSGHSTAKLENCYTEALARACEKKLKSIVFCLLGAGYNKFPEDHAEKCARKAIKAFLDEHKDTTIRSIQLVKFRDQNKYKISVKTLNTLKKADTDVLTATAINPDAEISRKIKTVTAQIMEQLGEHRSLLTSAYYAECDEFVKLHNNEYENVYEEFNDQKYIEIIKKNENDKSKYLKNADLAERIYVTVKNDSAKNGRNNDISKYKLLRTKNGIPYKSAYAFLSKPKNVLRLCLGLQLDLDDVIVLMLTRGHFFPSSEFDYEIAEYYIKQKKWFDALDEYEEEFSNNYSLDHSADKEMD